MPQQNAIQMLLAAHPWLEQLGIQQQLLQWTIDGFDGEAIVGLVRETPQWKAMFPGIRREDGTLRMKESDYLRVRDAYRTLIFNFTGRELNNPADFTGLFERNISPAELEERLQIWDIVQRDGGEIRSAFYVYAGMRLSDEDLYRYIVDREARQNFDAEYTTRAAQQQLTYDLFITRATEVGIQQVVDDLIELRRQGVATDEAIRRVQDLDPNVARQLMDVLYHGGRPDGGDYLALNELTRAFELAMIGSAATQQGFALPTEERVRAFRQAGIDRAKALEEYGRFAANQRLIEGMVARAGGGRFSQADWEQAVFLRSGPENELLRRAQRQEDSLGMTPGGPSFTIGTGGQLMQQGLGRVFR